MMIICRPHLLIRGNVLLHVDIVGLLMRQRLLDVSIIENGRLGDGAGPLADVLVIGATYYFDGDDVHLLFGSLGRVPRLLLTFIHFL